jgi:hypothetical protein
MVTSLARELASIFSITRLRRSLTVRIVIPNSLAICLLSLPATTWFKTSCSRGVNVFNLSSILSKFIDGFFMSVLFFRPVRIVEQPQAAPRTADKCYSLALLFRSASMRRFSSSGVSCGRSILIVSLNSFPVNLNGT